MFNLRIFLLLHVVAIGMAFQLVLILDAKDNLNAYLVQRNYGLNWTESQGYCKSKGMELASIHSRDEQIAIKNLVMGRDIFMGGREIKPEEKQPKDQRQDSWTWSDGTPFDYFKWGAGQPDNINMAESCLALRDGYFHDFECHLKRLGFICKKAVTTDMSIAEIKKILTKGSSFYASP